MKPNFKIGMTAVEVLVEIAQVNENIRRLCFHRYIPKENDREIDDRSFRRLLFHDFSTVTDYIERGGWNYPLREGITVDSLNKLVSRLQRDQVLSVLSNVGPEIYYGDTDHLPMMDFRCEICSENQEKIEQFLKAIGQKEGVILDSGRSYHYYGVKLMDGREWLNFLGDCLLFGLADNRYIGHRLKDGCGILRISTSVLRQKIPTVVSIL